MCVVVSTRNNANDNRYLYNIHSLLNQNYSNFMILLMDDASDDGTGLLLSRYLRRRGITTDKAKVIIRDKRYGSLNNIYLAVHEYCNNYSITLPIDGDD